MPPDFIVPAQVGSHPTIAEVLQVGEIHGVDEREILSEMVTGSLALTNTPSRRAG